MAYYFACFSIGWMLADLMHNFIKHMTNPELPASDDEYTCAMCGETFVKGRSEDEAEQEMRENFGHIDKEDCAVVCDDCYVKMIDLVSPKLYRQ